MHISGTQRLFSVKYLFGEACMTSFEARKNFMQISWLHIQRAAS